MSASRYVHIEVAEIKRETDAAFLCELEDGEEIWLPKSQIADSEDYNQGDKDFTMSITEWIANQKGLS